jgi:hypothetical protein
MILFRIGTIAIRRSKTGLTESGWLFYEPAASGHLLTCGLI